MTSQDNKTIMADEVEICDQKIQATSSQIEISSLMKALESVNQGRLQMQLAQTLSRIPDQERLAIKMSSPLTKAGRSSSLIANPMDDHGSQKELFMWEGWESHPNPAMARLLLSRANHLENRGQKMNAHRFDTRHISGERTETILRSLLGSALKIIKRSDAIKKRLVPPALELILKHRYKYHAYEFRGILSAIAISGSEAHFEQVLALIPEKNQEDPSWSPEQRTRERAAVRTNSNPSYEFWSFGIQGATRPSGSELIAGLMTYPMIVKPLKENHSPIAHALVGFPNRPELAVMLAEKGWLMAIGDYVLGAAILPDDLWTRLDQAWSAKWLIGDSSKENNWARDDKGIGDMAALYAITHDNVEMLERLMARMPLAKQVLSNPLTSMPSWDSSPLVLAAALGSVKCFEWLKKQSLTLDDKVPAAKLRVWISTEKKNITNATILFSLDREEQYSYVGGKQYYSSGCKGFMLRSDVNESDESTRENRIDYSKSIKVGIAEAALLSGSTGMLIKASELQIGFKRSLSKALDDWGPRLPQSTRDSAEALLMALETKGIKRKPTTIEDHVSVRIIKKAM